MSNVGPVPDIPMGLSWFSLVSPSTFRSASHFFCVLPSSCFLIALLLGASHSFAHSRCALHIDKGMNKWPTFPPGRFAPWGEHLWPPFEYEDHWATEPVCMFSIAEKSVGCTGDGSPNRPTYRLATIPTELSRIPKISRKQ